MEKETELIIANIVLPIVKDLLMPKISSAISKMSNTEIDANLIETKFEDYLAQRYEHFLIIDTLVFPNKQTLFKVLYEPLTVTDASIFEEGNEIIIDKYPKNFIPNYYRVLIEDTAGMGKSTISKKIFQSVIEQKSGIPVLIELRQINPLNKILKEIQRQLSPIGKTVNQDVILNIINEGDFVFLFDGFDEISNINRDFVINELHNFIEKANNNFFLITSRSEDSLVSFGDFKKFRIKNLTKKQAYSLISRLDKYSYKPIAKELIKQLEKNESTSLKEYLTNPLLVSLLYKSFDYKKDIPVKKSQFYNQVYDALFETHDLSKEGYLKRDKFSKLHIDDFERILRHIGYLTAIENEVEYDKNYILNIIEKSKKFTPDLIYKSSDFLKDLLKTVPIFKQEGNYYRWSHKSLQDYFAAKFIWIDSKEKQTQILRKIYDLNDNRRFINILDIYYELDPSTFNSTITFWLLTEFCEYAKKHITSFSEIPFEERKIRVENTFSRRDKLIITKTEDYEIVRRSSNKESRKKHLYYQSKVTGGNGNISYHYFESPKLIAFNYHGDIRNYQTILNVLSDRYPKLVSYKNSNHKHDKLTLLKEDEVYSVNYEQENVLNTKDLFGLINIMTNSEYTLNYDIAFKELKRLENAKLEENDLMNW